MLRKLNPVLHNELRLAIVSLLIGVEDADFSFLLEHTKASKGNLSVQITKLKEADYIDVQKSFKDNYPHTNCKITALGIEAFEEYVEAISEYLKGGK